MQVKQNQDGYWVAIVEGTPAELAISVKNKDEAIAAAKRLKNQMREWNNGRRDKKDLDAVQFGC